MNNKEQRIQEYKNKSNEELIELSIEGYYLSVEDRTILTQELRSRGLEDAAQNVESMFEEQVDLKDLSNIQLKDLIASRIKMGESAESIRKDFEEQGIEMPEIYELEDTDSHQELIYDTIAFYNNNGSTEQELYERIQEKFGIEEADVKHLKNKMKSRSVYYIVFGSLMIVVPISIAIFSLFNNAIFLMYGLIGTGFALLIKGLQQR